MSYNQYIKVLIDNWIDGYTAYSDYETALNMYSNDEEAQEYPTCLEWFNDYAPNMSMEGY